MRLLGELADRTAVRRVCDYLLTQGVRTQIDDGADKATVWVIDEDRVAAAKTVWAEFLADPTAEKYAQAETAAREIVSREVRRQRDRQQLIRDVRSQWEPVHGSTAITWARFSSSTHVHPPGAAPRSTQSSPGPGESPSHASASSTLRAAREGRSAPSFMRARPPGAREIARPDSTPPT